MGFLEGVKHAQGIVPARSDAVLEVSNVKGIDEVALALDSLVTLASRTPGKETERFIAKKKTSDRLGYLI